MLKILVVEDDTAKNRRVIRELSELPECAGNRIDNARDASEAKRLLREHQYDLVILDIALPERADSDPSPSGGIDLLQEVLERDIYFKPLHIVGLTAFEETFELAGAKFSEELWSVVYYEAESEDWLEKLKRKIKYITLVKRGALRTPEYETTLCVITALQDPELDAVLKLPWNWKSLESGHDCTIYHTGQYEHNGEKRSVVAASASRMGMTASAALAMKMITRFHPKYIAMAGILAGVKGKCNMGDVVAADPAWDYGSGKHHIKDGVSVFSPSPHQLGLDSFIRANISRLSQDEDLLHNIRREWSGEKPETVLKLHIAPVACGAAVLANEAIIENLIKDQHRKVTGIDMESYGIMGSANESPFPSPKAFCLKSVCDFANPDKNNNWQPFAAYTSASILKVFAEKFLG